MIAILDSMISKAHAFSPESVADYLALQLARKLWDTERVHRYVSLVNRHTLQLIVTAFNNLQGRDPTDEALSAAFEKEIALLTAKEVNDAL